jgi:hypothetical protein
MSMSGHHLQLMCPDAITRRSSLTTSDVDDEGDVWLPKFQKGNQSESSVSTVARSEILRLALIGLDDCVAS